MDSRFLSPGRQRLLRRGLPGDIISYPMDDGGLLVASRIGNQASDRNLPSTKLAPSRHQEAIVPEWFSAKPMRKLMAVATRTDGTKSHWPGLAP